MLCVVLDAVKTKADFVRNYTYVLFKFEVYNLLRSQRLTSCDYIRIYTQASNSTFLVKSKKVVKQMQGRIDT